MPRTAPSEDEPEETEETEAVEPIADVSPEPIAAAPPPPSPQVLGIKRMPLKICPTCKGTKCVQHGGRLYVCPSCHGSGGVELGKPSAEPAAALRPGMSKAAQRLARGLPNSMPVPVRRTRRGR